MQLTFNIKPRYICIALSALWIAGCNSGSSATSSTNSGCNPCTLFITESQYNGNLVAAARVNDYSGESIGVLAADYLCNTDTANPNPKLSFKAYLVDGVNRVACKTPFCTANGIAENKNWVLHPNTTYILDLTESPLFATNSSAIATITPLLSYPPQSATYWTGFAGIVESGHLAIGRGWLAPSVKSQSCSEFSSSNASSNAGYGSIFTKPYSSSIVGNTTTALLALNGFNTNFNARCSASWQLICIQQ